MSKNTQKIGNIQHSKDVKIRQSAQFAAEQAIGNIENAERVEACQEVLRPQSGPLHELGNWLLSLQGTQKEQVITQLREIIFSEVQDQEVSASDVEKVAKNHLPDELKDSQLGEALRDAASAISLVSGAIAIGVVTNPILLAIAIPAALAVTGVLQKDQLARIYRRMVSLRSE